MVSLRPPLLSPAPPSLCRTVWISRTSIFYVMNANMPNFQTSQRSLGVHRWKRGKEALKGFLYGLRRWYGWRWKGHSVIFSCSCCSFSCTLVNLPQLQFFSLFFPCLFFIFYFPVSATFFLTCAVLIFPFLFPSSIFSLLAGSLTNHSHVERSRLFCWLSGKEVLHFPLFSVF